MAGHTTLERAITGADPSNGYATLDSEAANGSYVVRDGVSEGNAAIPAAPAGRAERRRSLFYFGQLTDFQLADEESPARVEFLDPTSDQDPSQFATAAWRPQEALHPQMIDRSIHQMNLFVPREPGRAGRRLARAAWTSRSSPATRPTTSSATRPSWVVRAARGRLARSQQRQQQPGRLPELPARHARHRARPRSYTGVQDYDDYVEGPDPDFYDPERPARRVQRLAALSRV